MTFSVIVSVAGQVLLQVNVKEVAPPKLTVAPASKLVPVIVTGVPPREGPLVGLMAPLAAKVGPVPV